MPAVADLPAGDAFIAAHRHALASLISAIIPADEYPSAEEAGGLDFLTRIFNERPELVDDVVEVLRAVERKSAASQGSSFAELSADARLAVLDELLADTAYQWFAKLVNGGYYADPGNGGNRDALSWKMVDWQPGPPGGWPDLPGSSLSDRIVEPQGLAERYDAIIIGAGAGGGVAACGLSEGGRNVLVVEAGRWPSTAELSIDHIRNPRTTWGLEPLTGPVDRGNPRVLDNDGLRRLLRPSDPLWSNNAFTVGGGTRVYGAMAWRFGPKDFAMASTYGVPDGSDLADWPFGYDELAPYYERAEWEIGVSGDETYGAHVGPQTRGYPMPALSSGPGRIPLVLGAQKLGIETLAVPLLINSQPYNGRPACARCAMCVGFACPADAKNGSQNTMLQRAFMTGRCSLVLETTASRLLVDASGKVIGASLVGIRNGQIWKRDVLADEVVLSAGAVETARLLLNSPTDREPGGIGNGFDQVGRRLQGHAYGGAIGIFDDEIEDLLGPGAAIATTDFRHGNPGIIGGGIIASEFVPTPSNTYRYLADSGIIPIHGLAAKHGMRDYLRRMMRIMGPIQEVTSGTSRVRVDPEVRDRFGLPVARLSGYLHREDIAARDFLTKKSAEWLTASGAIKVAPMRAGPSIGPSGGQHQAGTCRMGNTPELSVTDPFGRVWGHGNLRIADASLHITNGGVNPVLSIYANAMRVIDHMVSGRTLSAK